MRLGSLVKVLLHSMHANEPEEVCESSWCSIYTWRENVLSQERHLYGLSTRDDFDRDSISAT